MLETTPTLDPTMAPRNDAPSGESIGERIRRLRLSRGLTQTELGARVGLSKRMVAYYEIQGGSPAPELLVRLADTLEVSLAALAGRKEAIRPSEALSSANLRLWRRVKRIEELPTHDRKAVLKMIDAMADAARRKAG